MVRGGVVVSPLGEVTMCCSVFWVLVEEFLEQSRTVLAHSLFDFLESVPWCPRGSVVGFPWVATFDFLHLSLKSSH